MNLPFVRMMRDIARYEAARIARDETPAARHAALLRYAPGARVPSHRHGGIEHILVLAGSQRDENGVYPAGTLLMSPSGSRHAVVSDDGCLVLAIWAGPLHFDAGL